MARVIKVIAVVDPGTEAQMRYVITCFKQACRNVRDGAVAVRIYDEDGMLLGADMSGTPSEAMQDAIETTFEHFEEPEVGVTKT